MITLTLAGDVFWILALSVMASASRLAWRRMDAETRVPMQFALNGKRTPEGDVLNTNETIRRYLLRTAGLAAVQFQAFGARDETGWFRLSAGAVSPADIRGLMPRLRHALRALA